MQLVIKRIIDFLASLVALSVIWPIMVVIAVAIKLDSPGPVFFLQKRAGRNGKFFTIYKFRTMVVNAQQMGLKEKVVSNDSRITRVGAFLRRWSLDELPQVINVLKGDMSIVGPRPTLPEQVEKYDGFQKQRLKMKPGMTSLAVVKGRNLLAWPEKIEYDVEYVKNYSLWLDFIIILKTVRVVFSGEGVYMDKKRKMNEGDKK